MTKKYEGIPIRKLPDGESYSSDAEIITPTIRPRVYSKTKLAKWPIQRGIKPKRKAPEDCLTNDKEYKRKYHKEYRENNIEKIRKQKREYYLKTKTKKKD